MRFLTSLGFVVHILVSGCADREVKGFQEIQNIAGKHNVVWDVERAFPKKVVSKSGKVTLRPCNADDTEHQNLFIHLYTQKEALKMYLDGSVRTEEEALNLLNSHSARWDQSLRQRQVNEVGIHMCGGVL